MVWQTKALIKKRLDVYMSNSKLEYVGKKIVGAIISSDLKDDEYNIMLITLMHYCANIIFMVLETGFMISKIL